MLFVREHCHKVCCNISENDYVTVVFKWGKGGEGVKVNKAQTHFLASMDKFLPGLPIECIK